ncbi:Aspartate/glutamate/uridylate kinase [Scenedesmus sp. NREL 46B-D3]|nr:Aspartate/glutamate/uridylate kinase [Scenedesmus sp. NREL 46B-D3]
MKRVASAMKAALNTTPDKLIIVVKIGTSSLVNEQHATLNLSNLSRVCEVVRDLHAKGHYVIVVSSGAVGVGCQRLGLSEKPTKLAQKQALAAIGQAHLMRYYEDILTALGMTCSQVLLTLDNLAERSQYINARNTFTELLAYGTIPVVNENDTVAVQELRFGDNDTLAAQVATLVEADYLFLMTDVDALYTANPKIDPTATPIHEVEDISCLTADTSTAGTQWGTGGMVTKLTAARIATAAGCCLVICTSAKPEGIMDILDGAQQGTRFIPLQRSLKGRKRWLLSVPLRGSIYMDDGAMHAIKDRRKSLFPVGVIRVEGDFSAQDAVSLCDESGQEIARGLANFDSKEVSLMMGKHTSELAELLGYHTDGELIHRGNLALLLPSEDHPEEDDCWPKKGLREKLAQSLAKQPADAAKAAADGASGNSQCSTNDEANGSWTPTSNPAPASCGQQQLQQQNGTKAAADQQLWYRHLAAAAAPCGELPPLPAAHHKLR